MAVIEHERRQSPDLEHSSEWIPELPIESTFPLDPEIKFRSTNREKHWGDPDRLTPEQVEYYQKENLICFLCEFAGKVPYKKIPGILTEDGRFKICNLDVLELAENAALAQGRGSREEAEYEGWKKALGGVSFGANQIHIVSPPINADYMLTFSVQIHDRDEKLNGRPVTQIVSRLDEDRNKFDVSRRVYERLQEATAWSSNEVTFNDAREFISNPILQRSDNPSSFSNIIRAIGIREADIRFSEEYEAEVRTALEPMISEYLDRVDELSLIFDAPQYEENKRSLDSHLKTIFSFAKRIRRELLEGSNNAKNQLSIRNIVSSQSINPVLYFAHAEAIRNTERATITGGTSCPSINSSATLSTLMTGGAPDFGGATTLESILHAVQPKKDALKCTCPNCEKVVVARIKKGTITCPNCKSSAPYKC